MEKQKIQSSIQLYKTLSNYNNSVSMKASK